MEGTELQQWGHGGCVTQDMFCSSCSSPSLLGSGVTSPDSHGMGSPIPAFPVLLVGAASPRACLLLPAWPKCSSIDWAIKAQQPGQGRAMTAGSPELQLMQTEQLPLGHCHTSRGTRRAGQGLLLPGKDICTSEGELAPSGALPLPGTPPAAAPALSPAPSQVGHSSQKGEGKREELPWR